MLSMTQVLLTIKFFVTLPQSTKVPLKRSNLITFFHLGESLNESAITPKKYCSILHSFLHKRKMPKNSRIHHNNTFLTDTLVKANTFNLQCSLIETGSESPANYLLTHHPLESVNLDPTNITFIILAFDVSEAHECDDMSVHIVKICNESLVKPLFNNLQFS